MGRVGPRKNGLYWLLCLGLGLGLGLGLSSQASGSPEYRDWLADQQLPELGIPALFDWTQPPTFAYSVVGGLVQPIVQVVNNGLPRTDPPLQVLMPDPYMPPQLVVDYRVVHIRYYDIPLDFHLPTLFTQFWTQQQVGQQVLSDEQRAVLLVVARQLDSARQHYLWNHWDLLRLVERLSLDLNPEVSPALMQWALLSALGLDVQLGRQENQWLLLFSSKQTLIGLPSLRSDNRDYWIDQGDWMATDSMVQLWQDPQTAVGSRLNVTPHPDSYYGSDWRLVTMGSNGSRFTLPVENNRFKAMRNMPLLSTKAFLSMRWPDYLDHLYQLAVGKLAKNGEAVPLADRAVLFVTVNFPEEPEGDAKLLSMATAMPAPMTVSLLRAFVLRQLLRQAGYREVVALQAGDLVTLGIPEAAETDRTVNLFGVPYRLLGDENASALVHRTGDTIGLAKPVIHTLY